MTRNQRSGLLLLGCVVCVGAASAAAAYFALRRRNSIPVLHSDTSALNDAEILKYHEALRQLKESANKSFQESRYEEALMTYQGCLDVCAELGANDHEAVVIDQIVRSNVVLTLLKLRRPDEARMVATFLLQDEKNPVEGDLKVKVLYRRGLASQDLNDKESALCDFNAAIFFSPGRKNALAEKAVADLQRKK